MINVLLCFKISHNMYFVAALTIIMEQPTLYTHSWGRVYFLVWDYSPLYHSVDILTILLHVSKRHLDVFIYFSHCVYGRIFCKKVWRIDLVSRRKMKFLFSTGHTKYVINILSLLPYLKIMKILPSLGSQFRPSVVSNSL